MPYILNTQKDIKEMLKSVGVKSVEDLYDQIPPNLKLSKSLNLPDGYSEFEVKKAVTALSRKNIPIDKFNSFLGAGCYDHYIPAAVSSILLNSQFLTAYTPYQAECSQGILQAIYEYQSYICLLTGMDVSNASLFDGASALAEAVLMALRITKRNTIIVVGILHPEYKQTLHTYLSGFNFDIQEVEINEDGLVDTRCLMAALNKDIACCVFANPNFFGLIDDDAAELVKLVKGAGGMAVMVTNPLSLAIFKAPAEFGVDIVCGDGQPLGGNLNFGGPSFGFLASLKDYLRQMPGRIVGRTTDKDGSDAYCLTLQAREQHIRREKAMSNICSNHSLNAIGAAVYLSLMGRDGVRDAAIYSFSNTQYLYHKLKEFRGVRIPFPPKVFNEFIWEVEDAGTVMKRLYKKNIIAGYLVGDKFPRYENCILSCCTEKKSREDIDNFVNTLAELLHG